MLQFECSVVIPSHNSLSYLKEAIKSIALQDVACEIIVVDDGSSDGTSEWLATQKHVKAIRTEKVGASAARNVAIEAATTDLIAFLDADDLWLPQKLSSQIAFHKANPKASFSFTDYAHINEEGQFLGNCFDFWKVALRHYAPQFSLFNNAEAEILSVNMVGTSSVMARRAALLAVGGYITIYKSAEDWELWLKLARFGDVGVLNDVKMSYLVRKGSITSNTSKRIKAAEAIIAPYATRTEPHIVMAYKLAVARLNLARGEENLKSQSYLAAFKNHLSAFMTLRNFWTLRVMLYDITLMLGFNRKEYAR
jgi:glycosyltransferase involved in cell wall biosynthesis